MKSVGLIAMSAKPFHCGHMHLIQVASDENDCVDVFISSTERKRHNELTISGRVMQEIWESELYKIMPGNVTVCIDNVPPVRKIYARLGEAEQSGGDVVYTVYADDVDIVNNFSEMYREKYFPILYKSSLVKFKGIKREGATDVSGTKMRKFLQENRMKEFMDYLPEGIDKERVWSLLRPKPVFPFMGFK